MSMLKYLFKGLIYSVCLLCSATSQTVDVQQSDTLPGSKKAPYEGAITVTGTADDGTIVEEVAAVVGGKLTLETVDGIEVGLYVLQAESWERLKPGGKGPTHLFNVTFMLEGTTDLIEHALGAVVIEGQGVQQSNAIKPFKSHHQVAVRLEQPGEYKISVDFLVNDRKGTTQPATFKYIRKQKPAVSPGD